MKRARACVLAAVGALVGCGPAAKPAEHAPVNAAAQSQVRRSEGRPPVAVVAREGDARGAVAVAIVTRGVAPERGAEAAVAMAGLLESRLDRAVSVVPSGDGVRARALVADETAAAAMAGAMRAALLSPVTEAEMAAVRRKLVALSRRPLEDVALASASACAGEAKAPPGSHEGTREGSAEATLEAVEQWRRAAAGLGRVAFATAGGAALADAVVDALAKAAVWPTASAVAPEAAFPGEALAYDATGDVAPGAARVTLAARVSRADAAVRAAEALGPATGALATRLGGLDAPARLREVTATAGARGGCLVASFEVAPRDLAVDAPRRIATAIALARQEIAAQIDEATRAGETGAAGDVARRAGDPRDAADLAAWWALTSPEPALSGEPSIAVAVGLATGRDAAMGTTMENAAIASRAASVRSELDRATVAWHEPVVESRSRVEKGQGELWVAFGSPCGTLAEMQSDAGLGAAFALAAAERTTTALRGSGARAEAWASPEGIGVVVHGPALDGEAPEAHARRLADAVGRSFAAEPIDRASVGHARARLLGVDERQDARALVTLAGALAPGHPSWFAPMGPVDALGRSSDGAVAARASALRAGPLRVAVLADASAAQADAAVRAVDRWVARRPGEERTCPLPSAAPPARAATYAVDAPPGGSSQAWLAISLPATDAPARAAAEWIAAALDGADGLLARALGSGLARGWSARVVGGGRASALVVRIDSAAGALDAAVAQVRALFDRLRQGSLTDADRAHAAAALADRDLARGLDPAQRVVTLWSGPTADAPAPTLDALRAFAAATLREDALVIVAVRPPRAPAATKPS